MRKFLFLSSLFIFIAAAFTTANAQSDIGIKPNYAGGEVTSLSQSTIVLKTNEGVIEVVLSSTTQFKRFLPENPSLKAALESALSEISVGDNLLVTGMVSTDKTSIPAKVVYLVSKSDITKRNAKENADWKTRAINGKVLSVDPLNKSIIVSTRTVMGETKTTVTPKENAEFHRYAPDSEKFSEALKSSLSEINPGDMFRAIGDKSENNTFQAEEIITGAFQTTIGSVVSVDIEKNEVTVTDNTTKKSVIISVKGNSIVKQFPAEIAQRLAMLQAMAASGATPGGQGNRPQGTAPSGQGQTPGAGQRPGGGAGQGGGMRAGSIDEMLEGFPNITVAELKVGDVIAVSSSKTANSDRINAIKLLSGVEPFLRAPQTAGGRGGGRSGQGGQSVSIPGLDDGFGTP